MKKMTKMKILNSIPRTTHNKTRTGLVARSTGGENNYKKGMSPYNVRDSATKDHIFKPNSKRRMV